MVPSLLASLDKKVQGFMLFYYLDGDPSGIKDEIESCSTCLRKYTRKKLLRQLMRKSGTTISAYQNVGSQHLRLCWGKSALCLSMVLELEFSSFLSTIVWQGQFVCASVPVTTHLLAFILPEAHFFLITTVITGLSGSWRPHSDPLCNCSTS